VSEAVGTEAATVFFNRPTCNLNTPYFVTFPEFNFFSFICKYAFDLLLSLQSVLTSLHFLKDLRVITRTGIWT
jgi:hypothetical protein